MVFSVASGIGMRTHIRAAALIAMLFSVTLPVWAATPNEFYTSLLRRGVAAYEAQRYDDAARSLRLAAFGFVDNVEQYQTAHVYLALTYERLGSEDRARDSARRVVAAQRIEARFLSVPLPQNVRAGFDALSARVLTAPEIQLLRSTAPPRTAPTTTTATRPPATTTTQPSTPPQTATTQPSTAPQIATTQPPATTQPRNTTTTNPPPVTTQPATAQPSTTQPATIPPTTTPSQSRGTNPTTTTPPPATTQPRTTPAQPQPQPQTSSQTRPPAAQPPQTQATPPRTTPAAPKPSAGEVASRLIAADRALATSNLNEARQIYRELLTVATERATLIRIAEGFYRARDFQGALSAFQQLGTLQRGEEPYRYYVAVSLYETGQYDRAKRELAAALPFIEVTPDVARYRTKIEGAL